MVTGSVGLCSFPSLYLCICKHFYGILSSGFLLLIILGGGQLSAWGHQNMEIISFLLLTNCSVFLHQMTCCLHLGLGDLALSHFSSQFIQLMYSSYVASHVAVSLFLLLFFCVACLCSNLFALFLLHINHVLCFVFSAELDGSCGDNDGSKETGSKKR